MTNAAYAFLNTSNPVCAWNTYRGELIPVPEAPGFVSVWSAAMMRSNDHYWLGRELLLEACRRATAPERVSRLKGLFCFTDIKSAERACAWSTGPKSHFRPELLAELRLQSATARQDTFDSNWITHATRENGMFSDQSWIPKYWAGEPCPDHEPIWETLTESRVTVLGTTIRERAYATVRGLFPDSLTFLEIARLGAIAGFDVGNIFAFLHEQESDFVLTYRMDMRDSENEQFLKKLALMQSDGTPINWEDLTTNLSVGTFGKIPDLKHLGFTRTKTEMPYLEKRQP